MISPEETVIKSVNIFRNGDSYFKGRKFIINCKKMKNFEVFLNEVTSQITPGFGAVRTLYTPTNGTKVNGIDVLQNKESYVAGGPERFKKLGYLGIESAEHKPPTKRMDYTQIKPVEHSRLKVSAKFRKHQPERTTIFVYRNGDELYPGARVLLNKSLLHNWDSMLETVTERVKLLTACSKMHKLDGEEVTTAEALENFQYYVAVGRGDRFKKVNYGRPPDVTRPRKGIATSTAAESVQNEEQTEGGRKAHSEPNSSRNTEKKPVSRRPRQQQQPAGEGEPGVPTKPVQHRRRPPAKKEADQEKQDQSGNFKSKRRNSATQGAEEVDESEETKVDVHVDHREAEEVEEEVTEQDDGGNQQGKQAAKPESKQEQRAKAPLTPHPPLTPKGSPSGNRTEEIKEKPVQSESPSKTNDNEKTEDAPEADKKPEEEPAPVETITTPPSDEPRKTPVDSSQDKPADGNQDKPAKGNPDQPADGQNDKEQPAEAAAPADNNNNNNNNAPPPADAQPQDDREATFVVG